MNQTIPHIGIPNARKRSVYDAGAEVPQMGETIMGMMRPMSLVRVQSEVKDHLVVQHETKIRCVGCIQPYARQELKLKPEGERSWAWQRLHVLGEVRLKNGEYFEYRNLKYRVMSNGDWSDYGYITYELVEGYES